MSQCHLSHKIPWNILENSLKTDKSSIILPVGDCGRIHCRDRKTEIKVQNRKFIKTEFICQDKGCETTGTGYFSKNKMLPASLSARKVIENNQWKQLQYFCKKFTETVFEFIESEKAKANDVCDFYIKTCDLNSFLDSDVPCTECYGRCRDDVCDNFIVFSLFISGKVNILLKLDQIGRVNVRKALNQNYGGQAVGNGFRFLMDYHILPFYLITNVIIACNFQEDSTKWGILRPYSGYNLFSRIQYDCDYKTFIPNLRHLLQKNTFMKNADATHILLKECFKCIYQYVYLKNVMLNFSKKDFYEQLEQELMYLLQIKYE
ncbi:uncharacterized protein LOC129605541 [Condylostylus longicornis]|uniref:uncharacterized protein LOC129605541 n=1 Tax=Condylostylus longicornis TaxID=2530218 RepID=UPI00244DE9E8|nr:uncharacterized protein LOC129605541 [Condylostylus longicornis]XP_055371344.1 uncharacterized protein LOC129605541 [Condylostylus longicornis]